jgi:hypothetical protein
MMDDVAIIPTLKSRSYYLCIIVFGAFYEGEEEVERR